VSKDHEQGKRTESIPDPIQEDVLMTVKQMKAKLVKLNTRIKTRQTELSTLKTQAKMLKTSLLKARAAEKAKKAKTK
jgi:hypothetical protein